jgi:site-specific recombinase XerD
MQNLARQVKKMRDASGVSEWGLHYSRNIIVSALCERGVDAVYLSGILGHTDINTINKYLSQNTLKAS